MITQQLSGTNDTQPDVYLVTGCCGFIGSSFCIDALSKGKAVIGIDNFTDFYPLDLKLKNLSELEKFDRFYFKNTDLSDPQSISVILQFDFDCVVHLAAQPGVRESITDPHAYFTNNIIGTYNLMNALFFGNCKKLVFASSSSIYSDINQVPYMESDPTLLPSSPYGVTKLLGEELLKLGKKLGIDTMAMRFFSVYGPRQRPDLLIPKIFQAGVNGSSINIFGKGTSTRDFTYIQDIVKSIWLASLYVAKNDSVFEIFNVGSEKPFSVNDIIDICETIMEKKVNKNYLPAFSFENTVTWADGKKIENILRFRPDYDLESGLREHWKWYKNHFTKNHTLTTT